jgi:hypothetical protein
MRNPHGVGFGMFGGILQDVVAGLFFLICFAIVVALLVVLVRFLLIATKAAEIYIAKNGATQPVEPVAPATVTTPLPTTTATTPRTRATKPPTP